MPVFSAAELIAVGSELLGHTRLDTNSLYITRRLLEVGITVRMKTVVGDSAGDVATALAAALSRVDLVLMTGGLGPTDDDVTREAVSRLLARPLREDAAVLERIKGRFVARGVEMPWINRRQAMVPEGAEVLLNPRGTAPGLWIQSGEKTVVLLPGPPSELQPMVDAIVRDRLAALASGLRYVTRVIRIAGRTESHVEVAALPLYQRWRAERRPIDVTILASPGTIDLHLTVQAGHASEGDANLANAVADLRQTFGDDLYTDVGASMEEVVGSLLAERRYTIAAAESCTGGLLTSRLTDVPGSSAYVDRSAIVYSNESKVEWLGVGSDLLGTHGAVSEPVAEAMAAGVRTRANTTIGVGITGIAGPTGGTPDKPVGLVVIGVAAPWGTSVRTRRFSGTREQVKWHASSAALDDVRRALLGRAD
jgi:nicotinamide-nucleotide amidase